MLTHSAGHDSSLTIAYPSGPDAPPHAVHVLRSPTLPYVSVQFASNGSLVAAGHDCQPMLFTGSAEGGWKLDRSLDAAALAGGAGGAAAPPVPTRAPGGPGRLNNEAFNRFKSADARGVPAASSFAPSASAGSGASGSVAGGLGAVAGASVGADGELHTTHQNTITSIRPYKGDAQQLSHVSTSGVDGRLCIFAVPAAGSAGALASGIASMRVA